MSQPEAPWYKQFWLWFILTPLFLVFIAGFLTLYLSIKTNDGVVVDNFYKDGKGIIVRHEEDDFAREHQLSAQLDWDTERLTLNLSGDLSPLPEQLELLIIFPTAKSQDVTVIFQHEGLGRYRGNLSETVIGVRQFQLQPIDTETAWRLHTKATVSPERFTLNLLPKSE